MFWVLKTPQEHRGLGRQDAPALVECKLRSIDPGPNEVPSASPYWVFRRRRPQVRHVIGLLVERKATKSAAAEEEDMCSPKKNIPIYLNILKLTLKHPIKPVGPLAFAVPTTQKKDCPNSSHN